MPLIERTKRGGGLRLAHVAAALGVMFLGLWTATEYVAHALAYQPQLGAPWIHLGAVRLYAPWAYFVWLWNYNAYAPDIFSRGVYIMLAATIVAVLSAVAVAVWRARETETPDAYGSAHWASMQEIHASGLLTKPIAGVVLGRAADGRYLTHDGPEHIAVTAPSRSGKGVGIVVPTLLTWRHSVIVNDIKGENWELTAGYRRTFSHVLKFSPAERETCRFNPLTAVRRGAEEIKDVQNITDMIVDPDGKGKPDHWSKEADAYLQAVLLHVLYAEQDKSLAGIARFLNDPDRRLKESLMAMLATKHLPSGPHPVIAMGARAMLNKSDNERSGVHSTARSFFSLYLDPIVAAATSSSDFAIEDLMRAEHPVSLYLIAPPSDKNRLRPIFRLILNQISRRLTEQLNPKGNRWRLLMLLDEFPALGRLEFFEEGLGFVAGYGIKCLMVQQSVNQIRKYYGPANTVADGAHVQVFYAPNTDETAKVISDTLGTATEVRQQTNYAGNRLAPWLGHTMVSKMEQARALLTPGEVRELPPDDSIVIVAGHAPIRAKKIRFFADPTFKGFCPPIEDYLAPPLTHNGALLRTRDGGYPYGPKPPAHPWHSVLAPPATAAPPAAEEKPSDDDARLPARAAGEGIEQARNLPEPEIAHAKTEDLELGLGLPGDSSPTEADALTPAQLVEGMDQSTDHPQDLEVNW